MAVSWSSAQLEAAGLELNNQEVMVPVWVRGPASAALTAPVQRELQILALGGSVSTPEGGIRAEAVVVHSWEELEALPREQVEGKIVVYAVPWEGYGSVVQYRGRGATEASRKGAVASLVRSATPVSLGTPHTGAMWYEEDVEPIPHVAITVEAAAQLDRLAASGERIELHLDVQNETRPDALSHNVIAELPGREHPEEIVVVGCHLDSWDVGQGAQDDGSGCVMAMEAGRLIAELPQAPRRTLRVVLFTNEENGLRGAREYAAEHGARERHVAAIEADVGTGPNRGFRMHTAGEQADARWAAWEAALRPYLPLIASASGAGLVSGGSGADIGPLVREHGAVGFGVAFDTSGYWPIHHTHADTMEKIDPLVFRDNVATVAVWAWVLAEAELPD